MYAFAILIIHLYIIWVMTGLTTVHYDIFREYRDITRDNDLITLRDEFDQYWEEKHAIPSSLYGWFATSGFEHLSTSRNTSVGFAPASNINDGTRWIFTRTLLYSYSAAGKTPLSSFINTNGCPNSGSPTSSSFSFEAGSWCGKGDWNWMVFDARSVYNKEMATQRARQQRTMQKFASYYTATQAFPNRNQTGTALTAGAGYAMRSLAMGPSTSLTCSNTYQWRGIPIDCEDMYDIWGNQITYLYHSDNRISIFSSTPFKNRLNTNITIGTDLDLS